MKMSEYGGAQSVPLAHTLICWKLMLLNKKLMNFRKIFRKINITDASTGAAFCSKDVLSGCKPSLFSALV